MKRKFRFLFPLTFLSLTLSGCELDLGIIQISDGSSSSTTSGYYKNYNLNLSGVRLQQELQKMCFEKHTHWISYGETEQGAYFKKTSERNGADCIKDGSSQIQYIYTAKSTTAYGTREHVWPCANSADLWYRDSSNVLHQVEKSTYKGGGSDLYHIRPCDSNVNSIRGNSKYVDFDDPEFKDVNDVAEVSDGGPYKLKYSGAQVNSTTGKLEFAKRCEPADEMKGDIARIIMYVYVHYSDWGIAPEGGVKSGSLTYKYSDMTGGLSLTSIMGYDSISRAQQKLKEWSEMDPPSDVEKLRNDTVQKIQGNRNPFVDYPELVGKAFNL